MSEHTDRILTLVGVPSPSYLDLGDDYVPGLDPAKCNTVTRMILPVDDERVAGGCTLLPNVDRRMRYSPLYVHATHPSRWASRSVLVAVRAGQRVPDGPADISLSVGPSERCPSTLFVTSWRPVPAVTSISYDLVKSRRPQ
jgi:hypothetical protein